MSTRLCIVVHNLPVWMAEHTDPQTKWFIYYSANKISKLFHFELLKIETAFFFQNESSGLKTETFKVQAESKNRILFCLRMRINASISFRCFIQRYDLISSFLSFYLQNSDIVLPKLLLSENRSQNITTTKNKLLGQKRDWLSTLTHMDTAKLEVALIITITTINNNEHHWKKKNEKSSENLKFNAKRARSMEWSKPNKS